MNTLREALQEYIDLRRGLGYKVPVTTYRPKSVTKV